MRSLSTETAFEVNGSDSFQIPVIDISKIDQETGDEVVAAAAKYGFIFVKSTGLEFQASNIDKTFDLSRAFFNSPLEEKQTCAINTKINNRGWTAMGAEMLGSDKTKRGGFKEAFDFGEFKDGKAQQMLSPALACNEADISHFTDLCRGLCLDVFRLFALGLKIPPEDGGKEWFSSRHDPSVAPSGTILRLLFYPFKSCDSKATDVGAGAHTDFGSLTLLFRLPGQPGLEILTPASTWAAVPVSPPGTENDPFPPILVNIGDLLSYWTNGYLKSTVHQVVRPVARESENAHVHEANGDEGAIGLQDRYSVVYFCHPCADVQLGPVPSKLVENKVCDTNVSQDRPVMTAMEYLKSKLADAYGMSKD